MQLEEYLSIPYRLVAYSAPGPDGTWRRYAEYPEIGCISEADRGLQCHPSLLVLAERHQDHTPPGVSHGQHLIIGRVPGQLRSALGRC